MRNPYKNIDWETYQHIISCSHWHCGTKRGFFAIYNTGLQHFALTNYTPSHPTYPLTDNRYFELSEEEKPKDIIESPNSEKVRIGGFGGHASALGSFYSDPGHSWDEDRDGPIPNWKEVIDRTIEELQYPDGGGFVRNHPIRTTTDPSRIDRAFSRIIEMLKYDHRVLGIEVLNHRSERDYITGYVFDEWDKYINSKGIRCFGFGGTDEHNLPDDYQDGEDMRDYNYGLGRNVMLSPKFNSHDVLKAYRNGEFYVAFFGDRIKFTKLEVENNIFVVETDRAERIDFISYSIKDGKRVKNDDVIIESSEASFEIGDSHIFVRAVAYEDKNDVELTQPIISERIYTQPILLKTEQQVIDETKEWEEEQERLKRERERRRRILLLSR